MTKLRSRFLFSSLLCTSAYALTCPLGCTVTTETPDNVWTPDAGSYMPPDTSTPDANADIDAGTDAGPTDDLAANAIILDIENKRLLEDPRLLSYLADSNPLTVARAAHAAGRMGAGHRFSNQMLSTLVSLLPHSNGEVRAAAAYALKLYGGSAEHKALVVTEVNKLIAAETHVRAANMQLLALGRLGDDTVVPAMVTKINASTDPSTLTFGARALRGRWNAAVAASPARTIATDDAMNEKVLQWVANSTDESAMVGGWLLARLFQVDPAAKTRDIADHIVQAAATAKTPAARLFLHIAAVRSGKAVAVDNFYAAIASDPDADVRAQLLQNLGVLPDEARLYTMLGAQMRATPVRVAVAATEAAATLSADPNKKTKLADALVNAQLNHAQASSVWLKATSLNLWTLLQPETARAQVDAQLGSSNVWLKAAAIRTLGLYALPSDLPTLTTALADNDPIVMQAALDALMRFQAAQIDAPTKEALRAAVRTAKPEVLVALGINGGITRLGLTDFGPDFVAAWPAAKQHLNPNAKRGVLLALYYLVYKEPAALAVVQEGLADDELFVARTAALTSKQLTGVDVSSLLQTATRIRTATPSLAQINAALASKIQLQSTRGTIVLKLNPNAPLTAVQFVQWCKDGKYNGAFQYSPYAGNTTLGFSHNGSPQGSSFGLIRDEVSTFGNRRGTFGVATFGAADTGSGQLFFNHMFNPSYDDAYTVVAEVETGFDIADSFELGDQITQVTVLP